MNSNDIRVIVNDENSFRLYVVEQFGKMDARMSKIEARLDGIEARVGSLESAVVSLSHQQEILTQKVDMGIWFTGICFGVLALIIAFVGLFAPKFWEHFTRKESPSTPAPAPAPTVIAIPQPDIDSIARKVGDIFGLTPKH